MRRSVKLAGRDAGKPDGAFKFDGWGGSASFGLRLVSLRYTAGVFEVALMLRVALGLVLSFAVGVLAIGLQQQGYKVSPLVVFAGLAPLCVALGGVFAFVHALRDRRRCRIHLRKGWVEIGRRHVRPLQGASIYVQPIRFGFDAAFARLVLTFPDGVRVALAQGPRDRIRRAADVLVRVQEAANSR